MIFNTARNIFIPARWFLIVFSFLFLSIHFSSIALDEDKPNIVIFLADDLGWSQLGCYGSDYYRTPHIDKLYAEGIHFTQAYAAAAVCSPTRASIMTGKHPARLHLTDFIKGNPRTDYPLRQPDWQRFLPLEEITLAEMVKNKDYATGYFGKWHLSIEKRPPESAPYNPDKQGFDEFFITYKPSPGDDPADDPHNTRIITQKAVDFLERKHDQPMFLFISYNAIHDPLMESPALIEKYDTLQASRLPENNPTIAAMLETLDESVGKVIKRVIELGIEKNTLVMFLSDNGGKHNYAAQTPFRKGKGWLYEGGIRIPWIIKWPGHITPGTVSTAMVITHDIFPTIASVVDYHYISEGVDGINLMPLVSGSGKNIRSRETLFWHYPHYHYGSGMKPATAIRKGRYKLIRWYEGDLLSAQPAWELYDLKDDPGENNNLTFKNPDLRDNLKEGMNELMESLGAQRPTINDF